MKGEKMKEKKSRDDENERTGKLERTGDRVSEFKEEIKN